MFITQPTLSQQIIAGEKDYTAPRVIGDASYRSRNASRGVPEFLEIANRGHALPVDIGWREVAATALSFVHRFV